MRPFTLFLLLSVLLPSSMLAQLTWTKHSYTVPSQAVRRADFNADGFPDLLLFDGTFWADDELIALMKQHGTWQIPTLTRDSTPFAFAKPEPYLNDPFFTRAAAPLFLKALHDPQYLKNMVSDKHWAEYPPLLENSKHNLKRLADAGIRYGFGTDAGVPTRVPAYLDHEEIQLMAAAGLTPMQIITAATKSGAEFLGARDLGTLERGKWADLIVLGGNPLADLKNSRRIESVYVAGNKAN